MSVTPEELQRAAEAVAKWVDSPVPVTEGLFPDAVVAVVASVLRPEGSVLLTAEQSADIERRLTALENGVHPLVMFQRQETP